LLVTRRRGSSRASYRDREDEQAPGAAVVEHLRPHPGDQEQAGDRRGHREEADAEGAGQLGERADLLGLDRARAERQRAEQEAVRAQPLEREAGGEHERDHREPGAGGEHAQRHLAIEEQEVRREQDDRGEGGEADERLAPEHALEEVAGGFIHGGAGLTSSSAAGEARSRAWGRRRLRRC
jgi:hypothetical protein